MSKHDGWITIGTELSTDKFDRQVLDLEKKMQKEEDKKIIIESKLANQEQDLEVARKKTDQLAEAYQKLKSAQDRLALGNATPGQFSAFQELQNTYGSLEKIESSFDKALSKQNAIEQKVAQTKRQYDELNSKVSEYKQKIEGIKLQKQSAEVQKLKNGFTSVGSSLQDAVRQAGRLVLSIFAIRSAYMALRSASSYLATYDKQYAANLEYIKYSLTQVVAPILRYIVNLAATLLSYINAIVQAWFGINLFSNASAKSFKDMKKATGGIGKSTSGVEKAVKEIKKQLAGFDEMNILSDNSNNDSGSSGGGGGAGGVSMPNFDLSSMQGEPPAWLKWIIDHKSEIFAVLGGIVGFIIALKAGLGGIKALGIGLLVAGIIYAVEALLDYLKDPSWENFGKIIQGIGGAIIGLGILIGNVPLIVAGAIVLIVGTIIKYWDKIRDFLQSGIDWLKGKSDWVHQTFGDTIGSIYDFFVDILQNVLNWFDKVFTTFKSILDSIIKFAKAVFARDWKTVWEMLKQVVAKVISAILSTVINTFNKILSVIQGIINSIINFFKNAINVILGLFSMLGGKTGEAIGNAFKNVINQVLGAIERILNSPINSINSLIETINTLPGVSMSRLNTFSLPRLKTGGIINMPNRGTLVGSAIGGEAGREGVIPLTDQQAMAELGREIGKNVLVNLTNITSMNGRTIHREIKQIKSNQEFAYNS